MALTVTPLPATSDESVFSIATSAVRNAFESARPAIGCFTDDDVSATIRPHPADRIGPAAPVTSWTMQRRTLRYAASQSSVDRSSTEPGLGPPLFATKIDGS